MLRLIYERSRRAGSAPRRAGILPGQTRACLHFHCARGFATQRLAHMLDSLVRVSRRVGWGANQLARDPRCTRESRHTWQPAVSEHCEQSTQVEQATRCRGPCDGGRSSLRECGHQRPAAKHRRPREDCGYLQRTIYHHSRSGPGTSPSERAPAVDGCREGTSNEDRASHGTAERQVEFKGETRGPIRLPLNGFTYS